MESKNEVVSHVCNKFSIKLPESCLLLARMETFRAVETAPSRVVFVPRESFDGPFHLPRFVVAMAFSVFSVICLNYLQQLAQRSHSLKGEILLIKDILIFMNNLHLSWSMLKSGPKNLLPIRNEGVADDMALPRSDCSSSV